MIRDILITKWVAVLVPFVGGIVLFIIKEIDRPKILAAEIALVTWVFL